MEARGEMSAMSQLFIVQEDVKCDRHFEGCVHEENDEEHRISA